MRPDRRYGISLEFAQLSIGPKMSQGQLSCSFIIIRKSLEEQNLNSQTFKVPQSPPTHQHTFPHVSLSRAPVKSVSSMYRSGARQREGRATGCHYYSPPYEGEPPPPASEQAPGYSKTSHRGPSASSRGRPGYSPTSKPLEPHPVLPHIYSNQVIDHCIQPPLLII